VGAGLVVVKHVVARDQLKEALAVSGSWRGQSRVRVALFARPVVRASRREAVPASIAAVVGGVAAVR
jgi:hypothetical protein